MIPSLNFLAFIASYISLALVLASCAVSPTSTPLAQSLQIGKVGERLTVGGIEWQVNQVDVTQSLPSQTSAFKAKPAPHGKYFVVVSFNVKNTNSKELLLATLEIVNSNTKQKYFPLADVYAYIAKNKTCGQVPLKPGAAQDCVFIYEVDNIWGLVAYVGDLQMATANEAIIKLTE